MESDTVSESSIFAKIESSTELTGIKCLFTAHLQPFTPFLKSSITGQKPSIPPKSKSPDDPATIRSLAKKFLPFLHKSLSLIPKRLSESPKIPRSSAIVLFDVYGLCLECLDIIAPALAGKPHSVKVQRIRYIGYLERWELYSEAEDEGFAVLSSFKEIVKGGMKHKRVDGKARLVPELGKDGADQEFASLILEIVVILVKCGSKRTSKVDRQNRRLIQLVNESDPWFRVLDAKDSQKFHQLLATNLYVAALSLVADRKCLEIVCDFSLLTLKEYQKSSAQDQMYKFVLRMCSSLFAQIDELSSDYVIDVFKLLLDFMASECKVGAESGTVDLLELVYYCSNKCHGASLDFCGQIAKYLDGLADTLYKGFPVISSILTLYGAGLLASSSHNQLKSENIQTCGNSPLVYSFQFLLDRREHLQQAAVSYKKGTPYTPSYLKALIFFCQSLAEYIYSTRKELFSEEVNVFSCDDLSSSCDMIYQLFDLCLQCLSEAKADDEACGDNHKVICIIVVAALMLSFKSNQKIKDCSRRVKYAISMQLIPVEKLKYLYVPLNNIAVMLKQKERLKETIKALKLCCKASWNYLVYLAREHANKLNVCHEDLSMKGVINFVEEASERTALLLELAQKERCKITGIIQESLKCWSAAENFIATLQAPVSIVRKWVKIQYFLSNDAEREHPTSLYSLLASPMEMSKTALGKLMEEELLSYKEKSHLNPRCCIRMQKEIIDILLKEIYATEESDLKKSRTLIEKGKVLRAQGLTPFGACIKPLSDAILTLNSLYGAKESCSSEVHSLLIHAYIMRALCTLEAVPKMDLSHKSVFLQDIDAAVKHYLSPEHGHADEHNEQSENMLYMWYQLMDLLSLKGYLKIHSSLYDAVIKLFEQKNFTFVKTVSELWKNKRLSHGLCASSVNCMFTEKLAKHQNQISDPDKFWRTCIKEMKPLVVGFHHTDTEIKQAATNLLSHVPLSSGSIFFSSHLYYILSGRLISSGQMIKALSYAKEAHRLSGILLQQRFEYSVEKVSVAFDEDGQITEKSYYSIMTFNVKESVFAKDTCSYEGAILTPWNVLSCYLEILYQVGVIQETLGNGSEAEMLLHWGKSVSQSLALPLFEISFSTTLGKLYGKQKLWCAAKKELYSAKKTLRDNRDVISCDQCVCMLEISIDQQLGDRLLNSSSCSKSPEMLFNAKGSYKTALDKLNLSEWVTFESTPEEASAGQVMEYSTSSHATNVVETNTSLSSMNSEAKAESKRPGRKKELWCAKEKHQMVGNKNCRTTRSTSRRAKTREVTPSDSQIGYSEDLATEHSNHSVPKPECSAADFHSDITALCNKMECWHCVHIKAMFCGTLTSFVHMNWKLVYRKLSLKLIISIGKLADMFSNLHEAQEILFQAISILFKRNSSFKHSAASAILLIESIEKEFPGDMFAIERAALIYYICWFTLKGYLCKDNRKVCSELSSIGTEKIISLLKSACILSREVPSLFQKICRFLALIYMVSTSVKSLSLSPSEEGSESQWASFFHQASLGTHLNQQMYSYMIQKAQTRASDSEDNLLPNSISTISESIGSIRLAPESSDDMEIFVQHFFQGLPASPVICISSVTGADAGLLNELLDCFPTSEAWIFLSHTSSVNQHAVLLPVCTTLQEVSDDDASSSSVIASCKTSVKQWQCPWVSSVIDDIAPVFRHVLEANYYSSTDNFMEYIKQSSSLWWTQRTKLDECLSNFLQDLEDLWLGPWKYLLLGLWPDQWYLDSTRRNLFGDEECKLQHVVSNKCYVGLRSKSSSQTRNEFEKTMHLLYERMLETSSNTDQVERVNKNPIILVLDSEVQMLPWENLPILRNQEVYRMPSVGSIVATIDRCCQKHEQIDTPAFPLIDPKDSYYLLNPGGDLNRTQVDFEDWFKDRNIEGKAGSVPTIEELTLALKNHDLFIYCGHGSGTQYIPGHEIEKLENCAATLLMGCSSGSLHLSGSYVPRGAPISYLLAGSPIIVANLWEVTDKDIDRFGKAMLNAWLRERATECTQCDDEGKYIKCNHRPKIGSFMAQAREACNLGYLIGAAPVCYGVPTGIIKRKNI